MNSVTKAIKNDALVSIRKACNAKGLSSIFIELGIESGALDCHHEEKNGWHYRQISIKQLEAYLIEQESKFVSFNSEAGIMLYIDYLAQKGSATVTTNPTKGNVFRDVVIEGVRFQGYVGSNGPAIKKIVTQHNFLDGGSVPLGRVTEIHYLNEFQRNSLEGVKKAGWWVCKYGPAEPCIRLDSLTAEGIHTLSFQFGIPIFPNDKAKPKVDVPVEWTFRRIFTLPDGLVLFFMSPSFKDLCTWAQTHAKQIRSSEFREDYLRGWKDTAIKREYVPNWRGWNGTAIKCV